MKKIFLYAALISCWIVGCKHAEKQSQAGVYKLEKQMIMGGGKDSTLKNKQIKIYTDRYYMYAGISPDSSVSFGVGTYHVDSSKKIVEHNIYSSGSLDSARTFKLTVMNNEKGYAQSIPSIAVLKGVKYDLKEEYVKLPVTDSTTLDGLWKMDRTFSVKGKDTTNQKVTQYKLFWRGHFIFIHTIPLTNNKLRKGFGYGRFTLNNDTLREQEQISNYALLVNQKFAIKITWNGNDEYTQVINDLKNHEQSIEIYRRVK